MQERVRRSLLRSFVRRGLLPAALSPPSSPPGGGSLDAIGVQAATDNNANSEIGNGDMTGSSLGDEDIAMQLR